MRCPLVTVAAAAAAFAGCGGAEEALPSACLAGEGTVVRALAAAPEPVTLRDGTRLSTCVAQARDGADLQALGLVLAGAADRLAGRELRLGYLLGAVRRGTASNGLALELQRRLASHARLAEDRAALRRGLTAGEATG